MPKMRTRFSAPRLFVARWRAEQSAIAATHQSESGLNKPDGPAAQLVSLPGALRYPFSAKQHLGDDTVRGALHVPVQSSQHHAQTFAPLRRQLVIRWSWRVAVDGAPQ